MATECLVKLAEIGGRGRGLVATQPLKAGQVVLRDSPILLYSAFPLIKQEQSSSSSSSSYCDNCFRLLQSSTSSTPCCPSCSVFFCSSKCLTVASSSSHSPYVCQSLTRLRNCAELFLNHPLERQVQARFLISALNLPIVSPSDFQSLLSLQGSSDSSSSADDDAAAAAAASFLHSLICSICPPPSFQLSRELTAALLAKDRLNAFGLMEPFSDGRRSVRAYGIYPRASFFNHDCLPNACRFDYVDSPADNNTDFIVRMMHDVPQGREVCLSYFPVNLDYSARQKRLLEDYGFFCDCDRCKVEANWSDDENDNGNDNDDQELMEEDEDEEEMAGCASENGETNNDDDNDFPHAYFFMRYMCDRDNCWGTLAPLPPSPGAGNAAVMECNVCGILKKDSIGADDALSTD